MRMGDREKERDGQTDRQMCTTLKARTKYEADAPAREDPNIPVGGDASNEQPHRQLQHAGWERFNPFTVIDYAPAC